MTTPAPWKTLLPAVAGLAALALAVTADAHGSMKPQHGGVVAMTGETMVELVNAPTGVALYVIEDDEDLPSAGVTATLTITTKAGAKSDVALAPAGANKLEAKGVKIPAGAKVGVMLINTATQARSSVTFTVD